MAKQVDSSNIGTLLQGVFTKIKNAFWAKGDTSQLSIDSTPTANSNNLVKSGGVKAYVDGAIPTVPTISTNIEQDKASDAKTASPKAVADYVDGKTGDLTDLDTTDKSSLVAAINEAIPKDFRLIASGTLAEDALQLKISADNGNRPFSLKDVIVFAKLFGNSGGYTSWINMEFKCDTGLLKTGDPTVAGMFAAEPDKYYTILVGYKRVGNTIMPMMNYRSINNRSVRNSLSIPANLYAVTNDGLPEVVGGIKEIRIFGWQATAVGAGTYYEIYGIDA